MPIEARCPNGCSLKVPREYWGKKIRCPECRIVFTMAGESGVIRPPSGVATEIASSGEDQRPAVFAEQFRIETRNHGNKSRGAAKSSASSSAITEKQQSPDKLDLIARTEKSRSERKMMCRAHAAFVTFVCAVNLVPAAIGWVEWWQMVPGTPLPFWVSLVVFASGWQFLFAVLLFQVPDWATLRSTAVAMLVVMCSYALSATLLGLMAHGQWLGSILQLPESRYGKACLWCIAMSCLAVIISLMTYRESLRWRRMEELITQLVTNK